MSDSNFHPIPSAKINRLQTHISDLGDAENADAQLGALFLAYCELKDIEASLPEREPAPAVSLVRRRGGMVLRQQEAAPIADQAPEQATDPATVTAPPAIAAIPDEV